MRYEIILAPEAAEDINNLTANRKTEVRDAMELHLRYEPTKVSRNRSEKLQGLSRPQYRLRVGIDIRVFYDVDEVEHIVEVLSIVPKSQCAEWLSRYGESDETSTPQ